MVTRYDKTVSLSTVIDRRREGWDRCPMKDATLLIMCCSDNKNVDNYLRRREGRETIFLNFDLNRSSS